MLSATKTSNNGRGFKNKKQNKVQQSDEVLSREEEGGLSASDEIEDLLRTTAYQVEKRITDKLHHLQHIEEFAATKKRKVTHCCGCAIMNSYISSEEYHPTFLEELANVITHAIPTAFCVLGLVYMVTHIFNDTVPKLVASWIYGVCMVALFTCSSLYHLVRLCTGMSSKYTRIFYLLDTSIIYVYIAACYTPFLVIIELGMDNIWGKWMSVIIWGIAVIGVTKNFTSWLSAFPTLFLYLAMGWVGVLLAHPMLANGNLELGALFGVLAGGISYTIGTVFWSCDGVIPFAHAIWHIFVVIGSAFHFHVVHNYLIAVDKSFNIIQQ